MVHELYSDIANGLKKKIEAKVPNNFEAIRRKIVQQIINELMIELDKVPSFEGRLISEKREQFIEKINKIGA